MLVLGLDTASTTGWALVRREAGREVVVDHGLADGRDHLARAALARRLRPDIVAIEDAWLGAGGRANPATLKLLARIQGGWEQAVRDAGATRVEYVQPQAWQSLLLAGLCRGNAPRAQRKAAAQLWVRRWYGLEVSEDEADAVAIATFQARTLSIARVA